MTPVASVIVPVFGPEILLSNCLKALEANTEGIETILCDNATGYSMDADIVIRNSENLGYGVASNMAAELATSDILIMLNVDTEVQPGWLDPLITTMKDPAIGMCGPRIIHPDLSLQTSGIRTWHGNGSAGGEELKDESASRDVDGVTGAAMMIRKELFQSLGSFDTNLFCGYEDVDMCLSVREAGWRIRYEPSSVVVHHESATGPERWSKTHQNIAYLNSKWGNR